MMIKRLPRPYTTRPRMIMMIIMIIMMMIIIMIGKINEINENPNMAKAASNYFLLVKVIRGKRILKKCENVCCETNEFYWSVVQGKGIVRKCEM